MKKVMLCVPIIDKTEKEITESVEKAKASFLAREDVTSDVEFVCDYPVPDDNVVCKSLYYTSIITRAISMSDVVYFNKDYMTSGECYGVHTYVATLGLDMIHERKTDSSCNDVGTSFGLLGSALALGMNRPFTTPTYCTEGEAEHE